MKKLLPLFLLCSFLSVEAQQSPRFRIGVESGILPMAGEINDRWEFRHSKSRYPNYDAYYGNENAVGDGIMFYAGLKTELPLWKDRLTISSGLRYTHINEKVSSSNSSTLYLFHPSQQGIELFRIHDLKESLGYFTIPLEADIVVFGNPRRWQVYVKGGIQAGLKVYEETNLNFVSKEMGKYQDEIVAAAGKSPASFMSTIYGSAGFRFIFNNQIRLAMENTTSHIFLTKNNFSLLSSQSLPGINLSVTIPVDFFSSN